MVTVVRRANASLTVCCVLCSMHCDLPVYKELFHITCINDRHICVIQRSLWTPLSFEGQIETLFCADQILMSRVVQSTLQIVSYDS